MKEQLYDADTFSIHDTLIAVQESCGRSMHELRARRAVLERQRPYVDYRLRVLQQTGPFRRLLNLFYTNSK